jgi:hypothetical protein
LYYPGYRIYNPYCNFKEGNQLKKRQASPDARQRNPIPLFLIAAGIILLLGVGIWQVVNNTPAPTAATTTQNDIPFPDVPRLSLADAKAAFDQKTAFFVDVRDSESFASGHIPGAINIPVAQMETRASELDANSQIITYCT